MERLRETKTKKEIKEIKLVCSKSMKTLHKIQDELNSDSTKTVEDIMWFIEEQRVNSRMSMAYPPIIIPSMTSSLMESNEFHPVVPGNVPIHTNDYVLIDCGFKSPNGMTCDITEMIPVGTPPQYMKKFVNIVEYLCNYAITQAREGMLFKTLEQIVNEEMKRKFIEYLKEYVEVPNNMYNNISNINPQPGKIVLQPHSLGHTVGYGVHDVNSTVLKKNSALALEPGIYVKRGMHECINKFLDKFDINYLGARCERVGIMSSKCELCQ